MTQNQKLVTTVILSVAVTAVLVGGIAYWFLKLPQQSEVKGDIVRIFSSGKISPFGEVNSEVVVADEWIEHSAFSLKFPGSWGLVRVSRDYPNSDAPKTEPILYVTYTFTSQFRRSHFFEISIANVKFKEDSIVKQWPNHITEDSGYVYNYKTQGRYTLEPFCFMSAEDCQEEKVNLDRDVANIMKSFQLIK